MTPKNTKLLFERHKHIFRGKDMSIRDNLMPFGFECGDGWFSLIDELCNTIERVLEQDSELAKYFIVVQVKEKRGTLSFYTSPTPDVIHWLIELAEALSACICEQCGNPGKVGGESWLKTLCSNCRKEDK